MRYFIIGLMAASLLVVGCSKKHKHDSKSEHDHSMKTSMAMDGDHVGGDHVGHDHMGHDHMAHAMGAMAGGGKVTVSKAGQAFKPPIKKSQVPAGVWICDMGTVHYARGEKGDGVCPLCKMKLKKFAAK